MPLAPSDALDGSDGAFAITTADNQRIKLPGFVALNEAGRPSGVRPSGVSRSGKIATGGQSQLLAPANPNRRMLNGVNRSAGVLYLNELGADTSPDDPDAYPIQPNGTFEVSTNQAVRVWGAMTGQAWTATES